MTTSMLFTALAAALHMVVLFEVWRFFVSTGDCREADKHIVATTAVGSVAFVVVQSLQIMGQPLWFDSMNVMAGLWSGFAIFNAALYYSVAKIMADRRRNLQGFDATDHYRMREKLRKARAKHSVYPSRDGDNS